MGLKNYQTRCICKILHVCKIGTFSVALYRKKELIIGGVKIFVKVHPQQDSCQTCESIGACTEGSVETEVFVSVPERIPVVQLETEGVLGFRLQQEQNCSV